MQGYGTGGTYVRKGKKSYLHMNIGYDAKKYYLKIFEDLKSTTSAL